MKYIHIDIKATDCDSVYAWGTVYDCSGNEEVRQEIDYPINYTTSEIAEIFLPSIDIDYAVKVDWIGGRPNDRK